MKLITITGASASGKDSILKELLGKHENVKPIVSVTTRPKRDGEVDGVEYKFITFEEFKELYEAQKLAQLREYSTVEGMWYYGIAKDDIDIESDDIYICILDVNGVVQIRSYLSSLETENEISIQSIFINCTGRERMLRSLHREQYLNDNQVAELCRRYLDDLSQVVAYRDLFDLVLKNESEEDLKRNLDIISGLVQ